MPSESPLNPERILEVTEELLRRFGPDKTNVVDVARELRVSHGSVYRHFPSKLDLRDGVVARWLGRISGPLAEIVEVDGLASDRLRLWLMTLITTKRTLAQSDPALFATYVQLAGGSRVVVRAHVSHLMDQVAAILRDGIRGQEFVPTDDQSTARAILDSTSRFHHPAHAGEWTDPHIDQDFEAVWRLIIRGLESTRDK